LKIGRGVTNGDLRRFSPHISSRRDPPNPATQRNQPQKSTTYKAAQLYYPNGDAEDTSLPSEDLPLLERPLMMEGYGILAFMEVSGSRMLLSACSTRMGQMASADACGARSTMACSS
jgi:hypothetical protein